jgi:methionyl-tRNA formyltransferase
MDSCLLFVSADTAFLQIEAQEIISKKFNIKNCWKLNRNSPSINSLESEITALGEVDYIFNFLSPKIFPKWLLEQVRYAAINFHPASFEYPGIGSASYSLFDKKNSYGVSAHYMTNEIDEGGIIAERYFEQNPYSDCDTLFSRALNECPLLLSDVINLLEKEKLPPVIRQWAKKATTRQEFNEWMTLLITESNQNWDNKIFSLQHPVYQGPFIKIGEHTFTYMKPK